MSARQFLEDNDYKLHVVGVHVLTNQNHYGVNSLFIVADGYIDGRRISFRHSWPIDTKFPAVGDIVHMATGKDFFELA